MKKYKQYKLEDSVFYKYKKSNKYLYHVEIFKFTDYEDGCFSMELISSGEFEASEYIGLFIEKHARSDIPGVRYLKETSLLAAPDEFIQKHQVKRLEENESQRPKRGSNKGTGSSNGNRKTKVQEKSSNK